jgi:16S rRNA A1518/A1519 N6-dimethyltransferase RsmA/KsgA/DIM1 with predicted DNA glycosylase/AP lyase activity
VKTYAAEIDRPVAGVFEAAGIDPQRRPETLQLPEFAALARAFQRR